MIDTILEYAQVYDRKLTLEDELINYFQPVAEALGFHTVSEVSAHSNKVMFLAEWFGPYQSHDAQWFHIPLKWIKNGENIADKLKEERENIKKAEQERKVKIEEEQELQEYERLKRKFER